MHESNLVKGIIEHVLALADEHKARCVLAVRVRVGSLAQVDPEHLREHFQHAAQGTLAADAEFFVEKTNALEGVTLETVELGADEFCCDDD